MGADLDVLRTPLVGASVIGSSHALTGQPCQDAFAFVRAGEVLAVAVADGMGSAAHADLGAQVAVQAAVEVADDVVRMTERARAALQAAAIEGDHDLGSLASTLLIVLARGNTVEAAHIGDGAIVGLDAGGGLRLLCDLDESEYVNEITPLTAEDWRAALRTSDPVENIVALALLTDGCQHAALSPDKQPHPGFLLPLFDFAKRSPDPEQLRALLEGNKMSEHSDDDKTLVLAWL